MISHIPTLALAAVLALAGCGGDAAPTDGTSADAAPDAPVAEQPSAPSAAPPSAELTGTAPAGSLGSLVLRVAESDADGAPATEVAAYLPPAVPADAFPTFDVVELPGYHVGLDESTLPDGFALSGTHFVFVKRDADGSLDKVDVLRSWVGLTSSMSGGTLTGTVGGFTLGPLWKDGAPTPGLTYDTTGDDKAQVGTSALPVLGQPAWVQPVTLPATVEDPTVTAELDISAEDLDALGVKLYLLYRQADDSTGEAQWDLADFRTSRSVVRARKDDPAAPTTAPASVNPDDLADGPTEAYLIAFGT